jgi:glycosyltransferase involved in cell wall biosynthesis
MNNSKKKLSITFLLPGRGVGGGSRAIVEFGNHLLNRGHKVRIFYRSEPISFRDAVRLTYIRIRYGNNDWLRNFHGPVQSYNQLRPNQFASDEIILSMCAQTTLDAHDLPDMHGIKVFHCHGAELENWDQMIQSWKLPKYILVVSSHLIDIFKKEVNKDVLGIVPDGVDCDLYYPAVDEIDRNGIGATFRWGYTKGPEMVLQVMKELDKKYPSIPKVSFGNGRKPNGFDNVIYTRLPTVKQAREIYSNSMVWLLTSRLEGFGMSVLEAMACGCVVVSTDCGGPRDVVQDGVNGYIVPVDDINAMMERISILVNDEKQRSRMAKAAIETAHRFSWDAASLKLEGYLYSIYKSHMGIDTSIN